MENGTETIENKVRLAVGAARVADARRRRAQLLLPLRQAGAVDCTQHAGAQRFRRQRRPHALGAERLQPRDRAGRGHARGGRGWRRPWPGHDAEFAMKKLRRRKPPNTQAATMART